MKKLISRKVAREAAMYFHKLEKEGQLHRRAEIFTAPEADEFLWVEVLVENEKVKVSTYYGAPRQDGKNVRDVDKGTIKDFYKTYKL